MEFLTNCFQGPALPASVLVLCVIAYWLLVLLGALDMDLLDLSVDADAGGGDLSSGDGPAGDLDAHGSSPLSIGMVALRFFNLGEVPLMVWLSFFAISTWALTMLFDRPFDTLSTTGGVQALLRNAGISLFVAKFCTQPLRGFFDTPDHNRAEKLIGGTCVVTTGEANSTTGQANYATPAAPLVINIRTLDAGAIATRGETVRIVDYEPELNTFLVERLTQET